MKKLMFLLILLIPLTSCDLIHTELIVSSKKIKSIYDGDTLTLFCIPDFKCKKNALKVRVKGVDTPEIKGKCQNEITRARKAKQYTVAFVRNADSIILTYDENDMYDRWGRLLAYISVDGIDLTDALIENNLGRSYAGGKRLGWC